MKITIEGASPEFERKLLDLLAEHREELAVAVDTEWNADRAERYLRTLPGPALHFLEAVVAGKGHVDAEDLRNQFGSLRGPTIALSRAMPRGVKAGWWPEGTPAPIQPVYDPQNPSWQRAIAYVMERKVLDVFSDALWAVTGYGPGYPRDPEDLKQLEEARDQDATEHETTPSWADGDAPSALDLDTSDGEDR
ncbi:hypothetical protein [Streptomyces hirsutus]|uniref:hypothetical protein n=1 Tax=Streptomyces hirsutus TaxID=35620 RepID=UPI00332BEC63